MVESRPNLTPTKTSWSRIVDLRLSPVVTALLVGALHLQAIFGGSNTSKRYWEYGFPFTWRRHPLFDTTNTNFFPSMLAADLLLCLACTLSTFVVVRWCVRCMKTERPLYIMIAGVITLAIALWFLAPIPLILLLLAILAVGYLNCLATVAILTRAVSRHPRSRRNRQGLSRNPGHVRR